MPCESSFFQLAPLKLLGTVTSVCPVCLFPWPCVISSEHELLKKWILETDPMKISRVLSLLVLSFRVLCPVNLSCLHLSGLSAPSPQLRESAELPWTSHSCTTGQKLFHSHDWAIKELVSFITQGSLFFFAWYPVSWKPLFIFFVISYGG